MQGAKYFWNIPSVDKNQIRTIAGKYNITFSVAEALVARGHGTPEDIDSYLFSTFEKDVPHASLLKDGQKTVDRIIDAIKNNEKILIFGDYDVDGITASSLMLLCLKPLGANINFFLPHRVKDGYGLSEKIVERAAKNNYGLIITVDNGITAFKAAEKAKKLGIDLIITDHHRAHDAVPEAFAIVNPNQQNCQYPFKSLAGVGVIFKVLSLLYESLQKNMPEKALELLLLGTIADVVPLTGENRFWVRYGLQVINKVESNAFKVLKQNGNVIKPTISATDIGFSIAPQINALGRLEDPREGVSFLIGSDQNETQRIGKVLLELNQMRREIERSIFLDVVAQIESRKIDLEKENIILAGSTKWPPGVIGLVASRLVSAYGKPTLLFHLTSSGIAKGSCRSIKEFNMFDALQESKDLLTSFGGHSLAAGLALKQTDLGTLKSSLEKKIAAELSPFDLKQKLTIDAELSLVDVTQKIVNDLQYMEPFGNENPQPLFYAKNVVLVQQPKLLKDAHVKCMIFSEGVIKQLIFFNRPELFELLANQEQEPFDVAVHVSENYWNGRVNIELIGVDVANIMLKKKPEGII